MRIRVNRLRRWRITSWPAACGMRCVNPSMAIASPSWILASTAAASDMNCDMGKSGMVCGTAFTGASVRGQFAVISRAIPIRHSRPWRVRNLRRAKLTLRCPLCDRNSSMPGSASESFPELPSSLRAERQGALALLRLARPEKRNALDDAMVLGIEAFFTDLPEDVKAVVLAGDGEHFSAGLDLGE